MLSEAERAVAAMLELGRAVHGRRAAPSRGRRGARTAAAARRADGLNDLTAAGQAADEATGLVANAVACGAIPSRLAGRYCRIVREDLPNGRDLINDMLNSM